jgi:hypothetical protein
MTATPDPGPTASPPPVARPTLWLPFVASLCLHALILLLPAMAPPARQSSAPPPLLATITMPPTPATTPAIPDQSADKPTPATKTPARPRVITARNGRDRHPLPPQASARQNAEMDQFLDELASSARSHPPPTLTQRALAQARAEGRRIEATSAPPGTLVELRPDAPPPDPFSLEMYVDALLKKLNRSAAFVRNDPRAGGIRHAEIEFRINPDGSLRSFTVVRAGDQSGQIAFVRAVVERALPFAKFPSDLDASARSLGMTICIEPTGSGDGFGFSRLPGDGPCPRD